MSNQHSGRNSQAIAPGRLEVISGCMFSGKTTELIGRLEAARQNGSAVAAFKHAVDTRNRPSHLVAHSGARFGATTIDVAERLISLAGDAGVIGVDEAQFFDDSLLGVCRQLTRASKRVIVAGLDRTCFGEPFEPVPALADAAGQVTRLQARCARCNRPADYTQRLVGDIQPDEAHRNNPIFIGAGDLYEPRCRDCFDPLHAEA